VHGPAFVLDLLVTKARGIRVVWTVHNLVDHESPNRRAETLFSRLLFKLADAVFFHCERARQLVQEQYRLPPRALEKSVVVPHPSYVGLYDDRATKDEARTRLSIRPSDVVFLFFGSIRRYKGGPELVDAFTSSSSLGRARLLVAGQVPDESLARELASAAAGDGRIEIRAAFVDPSEVQWFFRAADFVVFPYREVLTSGSLLLAMSFAKAVIVPRLGCISETVDGDGAIVYDPHEPGALSRALESAMTVDPDAMGAASRRRAEELTWDETARRSAEAYAALLR
jgi:glycosyltransferase involved in cell wall biosynthesis